MTAPVNAPAPLPTSPVGPATELSGHVLVSGLHDEGFRLVEQLQQAGVPTLVVDARPDPRLVRMVEGLGIAVQAADAGRAETLLAAGIDRAVALVCVESDDLQTLAVALLARELRPDLRIVVQLSNGAVGRALSDIGVSVLDVARLAAPSVVQVCLGSRHLGLDLGGEAFELVETRAPRSGALRELYGDLAPLAVVADGATEVDVAPGRDLVAEAGDAVWLVGPAGDVRRAGLLDEPRPAGVPAYVGARAPRPASVRRDALVRYLLTQVERRIKIAVGALLTLVVVSVVVLMVGYREADGTRMSVVDALYFTVETIGTVGYGDFYFRDQQVWLRLWAIGLMIVGATLATVFFALLTNALISRTIAATLGRRRLTGLVDHVVVVGAGSVGVAVVEDLRARDVEVVVVESDADNRFLGQLREWGVPVVIGDATLTSTLDTVRLAHAKSVAIMTSEDLASIETGLAVRARLGERWLRVPVALRIFDRRLAGTVATTFDFRNVRSPAALAAPWFVGAALGLDVLRTCYVAGQPMLVARMVVGAALDGRELQELGARVRVVSLRRTDGSVEHQPRRAARLADGDVAHLIGPYEELLVLLRGATA